MGRGRGAFMLVMLMLVVAACADTGTEAEQSTPRPAGLGKFYDQTVQWGDCGELGESAEFLPPVVQCARVTVPIDYAQPDGPTARIALSRLEATGQRIGSLVINPGGPGVSGLFTAVTGLDTPVAERFDRIGFDPRGVGASTPLISCWTAEQRDAERAEPQEDNSPEGIAESEADIGRYVDSCTQRSGTDFLAHVGTREVVQDLDVIRAVLGDDALTYLGYSYGTRIGAAYAEKFPTRVRALVLDGAVDPQQDPLQESLRQAAGFQSAFDAYAADCVQRPDCPLGTDPTQAVHQFRELLDPLWDTPAPTEDQRGLTYGDATTGVGQALYSDELWPTLTAALLQLRDGRGDTLLALADLYVGRRDDGSYSNREDAFNAIRCVDDPRITDRAVAGRQDTEFRAIAPFLDDGRGTGAAPLELCAFWPVPNTSEPHRISVAGLPKTVVVSTTGDPATPYQAGVDLADQLDAALITHQGDQHTVVFGEDVGSACVDEAVIAYLIDLTEPAPGLTC